MMRCKDCETIEQHLFRTTYFWLYLPTADMVERILSWAQDEEVDATPNNGRGICAKVGHRKINAFLNGLYGELNGRELAETKVVTTDGREPGAGDIGRVLSGEVFINRYQSQWIIDALEAERVDSWFQPILHAQPGGVGPFAHEALFRMRDETGKIMPPGHIFQLAGKSDLLFTLDLVARRTAVERAAAGNLPGKLFINFNPSSIYDPAYCLRTTAAAIGEAGLKPSDIVFEVTETHQARSKSHLKGILTFYRDAGFGVALDDIGSGYSGLNLLHELRPDYVKIDMDLIRNVDRDRFKQAIVTHIFSMARANGIQTIAEGIERQGEADWVRDQGADFVQGYLFGKPAAITPPVAVA